MPTLPWTVPNPASPGTEALIMASRFEVRSGKDVPRFFLKSLSAWRQVRSAPGALGASLIAQPIKGVFFTLSAWESREALQKYVKTEPHRTIMKILRPTMKTSTFTYWNVVVEDLPITWDDAKRRIAEKARTDAAGNGDASA
ncbi:antibiotic biosynthesis monooxygenase [Embleya sp. NBC_00896]|uniref:putative quinol monooxygenase n=1 Tax=Embleya sp. NBC_00896 TaxID=2975961 RepID=UPI002F90E5D3|nr:antibiotic biosynthesis monooxygenase [Embleya sp. NBC_00896]